MLFLLIFVPLSDATGSEDRKCDGIKLSSRERAFRCLRTLIAVEVAPNFNAPEVCRRCFPRGEIAPRNSGR